MEFTGLQTILAVMVVLTAAALAVFFTGGLFTAAPLEYATAKKRPPQAIAREAVNFQTNGSGHGASPSDAISLPAFTIDRALWERLVGGEETNPEPALEQPAREPAWPTGMIQQPAFQTLLDGGEPFSGLVVAIGVNDSDSSMWHSQDLMQSVGGYIGGLLLEKDFSCRTAYDEFIVVCPGKNVCRGENVCPGENGAQSQRRVNHISERLWDYQLRGNGACSILFSWGGVEVQDQPLAEAVASAVDRMRQTKRAGSPSGPGIAHRNAV
jgi:hypothetical protein